MRTIVNRFVDLIEEVTNTPVRFNFTQEEKQIIEHAQLLFIREMFRWMEQFKLKKIVEAQSTVREREIDVTESEEEKESKLPF